LKKRFFGVGGVSLGNIVATLVSTVVRLLGNLNFSKVQDRQS